MSEHTTDQSVLKHIETLVQEEQHLYGRGQLSDSDNVRLEKIKVELDRYWDLLRQRRAREEFGENPDGASVRPAAVVEKYEQ
jgi:Rad3-related DNA helicase